MTNSYYNHTTPIARFTTADAVRLNNSLNAIEAGFDKLPTATELAQGNRNYSVATNVGGAYAVQLPFTITSYTEGFLVTFLAAQANPIGATLNVNGLGPATLKRFDGTNLLAADIRALSINIVVFDGTSFRLTSMHGGTESLASTSATSASADAASASASATSATASANSAAASATTATSAANTATGLLTGLRFGMRNQIINPLFWMSQMLGSQAPGTAYAYGAGTYVRDRWKAGPSGISYSITDGTMTILSGSVQQLVQGRNTPFTGTYTLSWVGTAPATVNGVARANGSQFTLTGLTTTTVTFGVGTLYLPQLEFSNIATQFESRPMDVERLICYQYLQKSYSDFTVPGTIDLAGARHGTSLTTINFDNNTINFTTPMRATPTCFIMNPVTGQTGSFRNLDLNVDTGYTLQWINDRSFTVMSATALTTGQRYAYHWLADAEL